MSTSFLLQAAARILAPILFLVSLWVLWRGHNQPGGGFIGGLMAAASFGLLSFAFDHEYAENKLPLPPQTLMALGVVVAMATALWPMFLGYPPLTGLWLSSPKLGTPLLFDIGVYMTVMGMVTQVLFILEERI